MTWDLAETGFLDIMLSAGAVVLPVATVSAAHTAAMVFLDCTTPAPPGLRHPNHLESNRGSEFVSMVT